MELSSEKQYLVLDNQKLVYYLIKKLGVTPNSLEFEDLVSIGTIGLVKAAITFDTSKKIAFTTYASRCINNEIFMHYRKANKYANDISIDEPISDDGEGSELTLGDTIEDSESNFVEKIVNKEEYINLVSIVLNCLEGKHRIAFLYLMGDITQEEIADKLGISQSYVSRICGKAALAVQKIASQQVHYKEVFSMAIVGDEYRISFSSKDISKFNKIFATLLQNLTSVEKVPDFKVNCNRERIIIQVPAHPESFSFIAQIIQEIDDFSMSFVSNKTTIPADNTNIRRFETDNADERSDSYERNEPDKMHEDNNITSSVVTETNTDSVVDEANSDSTVPKENKLKQESKVKQVRDYMLSMNSFTARDLRLHFPNFTTQTISDAIYLAKSKGLITSTSKGKYVVNKN